MDGPSDLACARRTLHPQAFKVLDFEVVPGISSAQALAASHKVAVSTIGRSILITNGRSPAEGFPNNADSLVVLLNADKALRSLDVDLKVYWGANLGLEDEVLIAGKLKDVVDEIERIRAETRSARGWVMDTLLARRVD